MAPPDPRDLLLAPELEPSVAEAILSRYRIRDAARADADLQRIADTPQTRRLLADIVGILLSAAAESADPDQALSFFERVSRATVNRRQLLGYLAANPRAIGLLASVLGASPFMAEVLIRDPEYLYWITEPELLADARSAAQMRRDLAAWLEPLRTEAGRLDALRQFKRREILHVGMRDLARLASVEQTTSALTSLAEVLIQATCEIEESALRLRHLRDPTQDAALGGSGFAIIALGKLGGGELNFSSDVDLLYVAASPENRPDLTHALNVPLPDFHERLARAITSALSEPTNEGHLFRVDLRLRPEGRAGALVQSLPAMRDYYATRGATWERLALVKAWPVAGDAFVARQFLDLADAFVYGGGLDSDALEDVRAAKARIDRKLAERGQTMTHVKLGLGGIREIELIAQALQVTFGGQQSRLRQRGTLAALSALADARLISADEHESLATAYRFLRDVENKLQMVHDTQSHELPDSPQQQCACALRLGYRDTTARDARTAFLADYRLHTTRVSALFQRLFDPANPSRFSGASQANESV